MSTGHARHGCRIALLVTALLLTACTQPPPPAAPHPDFKAPLPTGMLALRKIAPDQYPDFGAQPVDVARLRASIDQSLRYLSAPSSEPYYPYLDITHDRAVATLQRLCALCDQQAARGAWDGTWFNQQIAANFDVYKSIGAPASDGSGYTDRVLFTGYCTPIYDASPVRTGPFQWPLYKLPDDNIGKTYTRRQIESQNLLAGHELVWLASRWEAYIVTIQGSARLRMADTGKLWDIGFAGDNGYTYTSPGQQMVAEGVITRDQLSLKGLAAYFTAHPEAMDHYLLLNQRYIFFTDRPGGPFGCLNTKVTPLASIATDKSTGDIYPRAMPAFLSVPIPDESGGVQPFAGFLLDQDTGGAIRASGRCDIYMGVGPQAEAMAGHELQEGSLYYLAVKPGSLQESSR